MSLHVVWSTPSATIRTRTELRRCFSDDVKLRSVKSAHSSTDVDLRRHTRRCVTTAEKFRGTKIWAPFHHRGACAPRPAKGQAGSWVRPGRCLGFRGFAGGAHLTAVRVRGYHPRKIFENSDAKSFILVFTILISGLPRTCISEQTTILAVKFLDFENYAK